MKIYAMTAKANGLTFAARFTVEPSESFEAVCRKMVQASQNLLRAYMFQSNRPQDGEGLHAFEIEEVRDGVKVDSPVTIEA